MPFDLTGQDIWNLLVFFGVLATRTDVRELCGHGNENNIDIAIDTVFIPMGLSLSDDNRILLRTNIMLLGENGWNQMNQIRIALCPGGGGGVT